MFSTLALSSFSKPISGERWAEWWGVERCVVSDMRACLLKSVTAPAILGSASYLVEAFYKLVGAAGGDCETSITRF